MNYSLAWSDRCLTAPCSSNAGTADLLPGSAGGINERSNAPRSPTCSRGGYAKHRHKATAGRGEATSGRPARERRRGPRGSRSAAERSAQRPAELSKPSAPLGLARPLGAAGGGAGRRGHVDVTAALCPAGSSRGSGTAAPGAAASPRRAGSSGPEQGRGEPAGRAGGAAAAGRARREPMRSDLERAAAAGAAMAGPR